MTALTDSQTKSPRISTKRWIFKPFTGAQSTTVHLPVLTLKSRDCVAARLTPTLVALTGYGHLHVHVSIVVNQYFMKDIHLEKTLHVDIITTQLANKQNQWRAELLARFVEIRCDLPAFLHVFACWQNTLAAN